VLQPDFAGAEERALMLAEIAAYAPWAQHYSSYNLRHSWTAFALRGYDAADAGFIIKPDDMSKRWQAENPARMAARCRATDERGSSSGRRLTRGPIGPRRRTPFRRPWPSSSGSSRGAAPIASAL
jgi:hypothetical protein